MHMQNIHGKKKTENVMQKLKRITRQEAEIAFRKCLYNQCQLRYATGYKIEK